MTDTTTPTPTPIGTGAGEGRRIEYRPLAELAPQLNNPKAHDLELLNSSVGRFGYIEPTVLDERTGRIISGHGRADTLRSMEAAGQQPPDGIRVGPDGHWLAPVVVGWASRSDAEANAAVIALNRTTEVGGWVDETLLELLDGLAATEGGLDGVGYGLDDLDELRARLDAIGQDDPWRDRALQPLPDPGEVEAGQLWRVGRHLLACGDSREPETWRRLLAGQAAQMLFTDPPYGIGYDGGGGVEREVLEGDATVGEAVTLLGGVLDALAAAGVTGPGCGSYVCLPPGTALPPFMALLHGRELYRWMLVWVKNNATFGRADYHQQHEVILYGWWPGGARHPVADRTQTSVWLVDRPSDSDRHPTAKPPELAMRAIANSTDEAGIVVDPFAGSGSTLVAAQRTGRTGVGCEWEPGYVAEALKWLAEETGEDPELVTG